MSRHRARGDAGSALVEFVGLAVVMIVPVFYLVLTAGTVERAAFGAVSAARDAGRAYATAGGDALGRARAELAADLALTDVGLPFSSNDVQIQCGLCDYAPGSTVRVTIHFTVPLPGLPAGLCRGGCVAGVPVRSSHVEVLPCFAAGGGPPAPVATPAC